MAKKRTTEAEKKLIEKYDRRFRKSQTAFSSKRKLWAELDLFDRGDQWSTANLPPWIPKPVTNFIRYIRTLKRANLASAIPMSRFSALSQENSEFITRLQKAYEHVWQWEKVPRTVRRSIDRAMLQGTAIAYVYDDDSYIGGVYKEPYNAKNQLFQGKICVKRIPIANFFPDPDVYRIEDCKFVDITELVPLDYIRKNKKFQDYAGEDRVKNIKITQPDTEDDSSGTIYTRDVNPTNQQEVIQGDELVTLHSHWERVINDDGQWDYTVTYWMKEINFPLLKVDIEIGEYPFAVLYDEEEEDDFFGGSIAMEVLENQKIINKTQQTASIIGVLHQNPQKVVSRESGINAQELAKTSTLPGKVWTTNSDPQNSIVNLKPEDIPKGLFELDDRVRNNVMETAGVNEAYTGQSVGSLTTSTGVNSLIERATIRDKDKMIQIDEFCERISHLIVLHVLHKWKDTRPIPTRKSDGSMNYETYEPIPAEEIKNLEWYVKCDTYASAPTTQAQRRQQADNLLQQQGQFQFNPPIITPQEWIKFQDNEFTEDILRRMQQDQQALEREKALDTKSAILQIANQIQQFQAQGMSPQEVQQMAEQFATQLMEQRKQAGQVNAPNAPTPPQGVTGALAMSAMTKGN